MFVTVDARHLWETQMAKVSGMVPHFWKGHLRWKRQVASACSPLLDIVACILSAPMHLLTEPMILNSQALKPEWGEVEYLGHIHRP